MKEIKAYLPPELVEQLSSQAKEQGINRSELIRNRLMANPFNFKLSPNDFQKTGSFKYLRSGLLKRWELLNKENTYPNMLPKLDVFP